MTPLGFGRSGLLLALPAYQLCRSLTEAARVPEARSATRSLWWLMLVRAALPMFAALSARRLARSAG